VGLDLAELVNDPRFATNPDRVRHRQALRDRIVVRLAARTAREWEDGLKATVPCTRVRTVAELADDEQLASLDLVRALPAAGAPDLQVVDLPFRRDGERSGRWDPPPQLGQHTDEVLAELGLDPARIAELRAGGVVA
jgi:crotonobetainyl-CoA:carnitine CoA-transferase CaiB-like acyl-CoA transferase